MRKSASDSGSKNYSSSHPPASSFSNDTTCDEAKIGPIGESFLIHPRSSSEYISIPTSVPPPPFIPPGFVFSNQVLLANHFAQHNPGSSKGQVTLPDSQASSTDDDQYDSNFRRMFTSKRRPIKGMDESMNAKNIRTMVTDGEMVPSKEEENFEYIATIKGKDQCLEREEKINQKEEENSNTLPHPTSNSIPSSLFKMSYSSDEIDRLLQMTPEKSRWNKSELRKKMRIRNAKELGERRKSGNERKALKESFSFYTNSNEDGGLRNDDESCEESGGQNFGKKKCMNYKEHSNAVGISSRSRTCSLCLEARNVTEFHTIWSCGCSFCRPCLSQYLMTCIQGNINVPFLACPSADCHQTKFKSGESSQPASAVKQVLSRTFTSLIRDVNSTSSGCNLENKFSRQEIEMLVDEKCFDLYLRFKTEFEVEMDPNRTFCPSVDCENICIISKSMIVSTDPIQLKSTNSSVMISSFSVSSTLSSLAAASSSAVSSVIKKGSHHHFASKETDAIPVLCNKCDRTFCCRCRKQPFHFGSGCTRPSLDQSYSFLIPGLDGNDDPEIKRCPRCSIWIEREDGCAQMMCRKCRHVFCWFCLQSLEDDLLLRHFDHGPCKNKLGHSRASVIWHRTQVVGIFAGFGVLLLLASPLFLVAAPCFFCCSCCCSSFSTLTEGDEDDDISHSPSLPNDEDNQETITKQPTLV